MLNHIQVEYRLLKAFEEVQTEMVVSKQYGDTIYSIPLVGETQRANIRVEIVDRVYCTECKLEIVNPNYKQTKHEKCSVNKETIVSEEYDPDAGKPKLDVVMNDKDYQR